MSKGLTYQLEEATIDQRWYNVSFNKDKNYRFQIYKIKFMN